MNFHASTRSLGVYYYYDHGGGNTLFFSPKHGRLSCIEVLLRMIRTVRHGVSKMDDELMVMIALGWVE